MIIVECDPDEVFIKIITTNKKVKHENGKSEVLKRMKKQAKYNGMIDEDVGTISPELSNYQMVEDLADTSLMSHQTRKTQNLVILKPRFEEWLYRRANVNGLRISTYKLPHQPRDLKRISHYEQKQGFKDLITDLLKVDDLISTISNWL